MGKHAPGRPQSRLRTRRLPTVGATGWHRGLRAVGRLRAHGRREERLSETITERALRPSFRMHGTMKGTVS